MAVRQRTEPEFTEAARADPYHPYWAATAHEESDPYHLYDLTMDTVEQYQLMYDRLDAERTYLAATIATIEATPAHARALSALDGVLVSLARAAKERFGNAIN